MIDDLKYIKKSEQKMELPGTCRINQLVCVTYLLLNINFSNSVIYYIEPPSPKANEKQRGFNISRP